MVPTEDILNLVWRDTQLVADDARLLLSPCDWRRFCERLDESPREIPELRRLLERPSRFQDA